MNVGAVDAGGPACQPDGVQADIDADLVSVIIVNYNGMRFLNACLESLHTAFVRHPMEIVIVDNCSTDGSREWLQARTDIVFVPSSENLGFTGGNNLGAQHARGPALLFINNDTLVQSALDPLVEALRDPRAGIVGCRLVYGDGRQQFSFGYDHTPWRIVLSWLGVEKNHRLPTVFRRLETDPAKYQRSHDSVSWVSGACFAIRASDWARLQGFDTRFFMYCEDVDLCLRARQAGLQVRYLHDTLVTHYEGNGRAWSGQAALQRTATSYLLFTRKHSGRAAAALVGFGVGLIFFARAAAFALLSFAQRGRREVLADKAHAFASVARSLVVNGLFPAQEARH